MMKFIQSLFYLLCLAAAVLFAWLYWTGMVPERMKSTVSTTGTEVQLRITGTRDWRPEFKTTLALNRPDGDRFVYDLQKLNSRKTLDRLVKSLQWIDGDTLTFINAPKNKRVTISTRDGLWNLEEQHLVPKP